MSNTSIIMGESGTGKSTSIRNLDPEETFIIAVLNKPLPFRGYKSKYTRVSADGLTGNYYSSMNYQHIELVLKKIDKVRPEIKTIIIDDFQYLMCDEFMDRALEKGYDKFSSIGQHAYNLLKLLPTLREDLDIFIMAHSEPNEDGKMKIKTIGKMLDEKITIEGMYAMVLQTELTNGNYHFVTQGDVRHIAKSPMGMFDHREIPNDLAFVKAKMYEYNHEDIAI
jgi:hypothetical protein